MKDWHFSSMEIKKILSQEQFYFYSLKITDLFELNLFTFVYVVHK